MKDGCCVMCGLVIPPPKPRAIVHPGKCKAEYRSHYNIAQKKEKRGTL